MTAHTAQAILSSKRPKGLKRFVLAVLALDAALDGTLSFAEGDQQRLAAMCQMEVGTRFSRIVEELRFEGFISLDGENLTVYDGGQQGAAVDSGLEQPTLLQSQASVSGQGVPGGSESGAPSPQNAVNEVLAQYVELFGPRKWGEDDRREVRAALEVASVDELKEAIKGNKLSAFHQGENSRQKKYNTLGHIIRGKRGVRTRRENIDMFRDFYKKAQAASGGVKAARSGADPAIIKTRKEEIRRAHRLPDDPEAQERASRAEEWLREHGIQTQRKDDGYPIWPEGD